MSWHGSARYGCVFMLSLGLSHPTWDGLWAATWPQGNSAWHMVWVLPDTSVGLCPELHPRLSSSLLCRAELQRLYQEQLFHSVAQ